jgi:hypothetical protein
MKYLAITDGPGQGYKKRQRDLKGQFIPSQNNQSKEQKMAERREYSKHYFKQLRLKVLLKYGGTEPKCACCLENFIGFLTVDHVQCDGKIDRNNRPGCGFLLDILRNPLDRNRYQILCYNCNMYKRADKEKICHHQQS